MELNLIKLPIRKGNVALKIAPGHFATNHSHINYYIDVTTMKTRLSEAQAVAKELVKKYMSTTIVDTILCLEGTEVIGTCLAQALTEAGFLSINAHQTIYVIKPEYNTNSQLIFRENIQPMVRGKHVLVLMASVSTGKTMARSVECVQYYGGIVVGISAIYSDMEKSPEDIPVNSLYSQSDLPDYASYSPHDCPLCRKGIKIDALVSSYGYSML